MISEAQVKRYCSEDISEIENYDLAVNDNTQMWDCHHKLEIQGQFRNSISLLKKAGLYYNVPAWQLVFLAHGEHMKLHNSGGKNPFFGKHHSTKMRKKMSMSNSGEKNPMFGKHHSAESLKKMSIAHSGEKNPMFGKCGEKNPMFGKRSEKCPVFGTQWWNNGAINKRSRECPGQGWVRGRTKTSKKTK